MNIRQLYQSCILGSLLLTSQAISQPKTPVEQADNLVAQWISIEQQNNQLRNRWQENKQLLQQRITLLQSEKEQLRSLTNSHVQKGDDVDVVRQELLTLQSSMESQQTRLDAWLKTQFSHVKNLHPQLPPPLADSWRNTLKGLDPSDASKRLETLFNLYQAYVEFNGRISTRQAKIIDQQGQPKMVNQLFLGAARGWYITLDGQRAIAGFPRADGWQWQHDNPVPSQQLSKALLMLEHKMEAQLVTFPFSLSHISAGAK